MPEATKYTQTLTAGGVTFARVANANGTVSEKATPTVPGAKAGTLTGRTDANTGVITLPNGHGLSNGVGDVFWDGGSRHGMTWTISTNALTIDGGTGDDLPPASPTPTPVTVMKPVSVPLTVDGDTVTAIGARCPAAAYVAPYDNDDETPAEIAAWPIGPNLDFIWKSGQGITNPLAAKVTSVVKITHASPAPQVVTVIAVTGNGS